MIKIAILDSEGKKGVTAIHIETGSDMGYGYTWNDYKFVFDNFFREAETADLIFVDFGELASLNQALGVFDTYREVIHFLEEHPNKNVYFCLTMDTEFYDEYEDIWAFQNAIKIAYKESPYAQRNLIKEYL
jgi:hypothetical protein